MSAPDEESALLGLAPAAPVRTVAYGAHPDQVVDLYGPWGAGAGPPVVLLHGGFWRAAYDRRHLSPLAAELAARGLPVALAEYRRVGAGGGAPRTFEDVAAAVEAVAYEAGAPGTGADAEGPRAAAGRGPVLVGHSAGGHLALLAAARPGTPVTRVLAVSPVADLARAHELGLSDGAVAELLGDGDGPAFAERLAAADPLRRPPLPGIPVTILHGTDDPDVPPDLSRRYAAAHPAATDLRELPGVGHYAPVTPGTAACRTLVGLLAPVRPRSRG
ncbi:alpha/beta fold hydrolase [Streptomyces gilvosporeus]|uniref:Alpha/beta hydrolase n=1 Tax=Streptomyces gilvosporeus TaxID=553510 RepID=A0A1V0TTA2_9ACTN|nr:alpha/beta hydrolase [Streptomyces gilvosporeus]ARF56189.1 alpha/beta hydrolase [Streptomyces gilvosporeus]